MQICTEKAKLSQSKISLCVFIFILVLRFCRGFCSTTFIHVCSNTERSKQNSQSLNIMGFKMSRHCFEKHLIIHEALRYTREKFLAFLFQVLLKTKTTETTIYNFKGLWGLGLLLKFSRLFRLREGMEMDQDNISDLR